MIDTTLGAMNPTHAQQSHEDQPRTGDLPVPIAQVTDPSAAPGSPVINAAAAAKTLCEYFLANAERGDHAANDHLVAELVNRIRARQQTPM